MDKPLNILLVAGESAGIKALRQISAGGHRLVAVLASRKKAQRAAATVAAVADQMGCDVWPAKRVKDPGFARSVQNEQVDLLLSVRSLYIIHPRVLHAPRIGAFNMHTGPLPRYAGRNVISWAIYRGESTHGVTIHRMLPQLDAGPIAYRQTFPIEENDNALSVTRKCVEAGIPLLMKLIAVASQDPRSIPQVEQDLSARECFGAEVPDDGRLVWSRPAEQVANFVRACDFFPFPSPWGYPRAGYKGRQLGIAKAKRTGEPSRGAPGTVGRVVGPAAMVACGDQWLSVETVIDGDQRLEAAEVFKAGDRLGDGI